MDADHNVYIVQRTCFHHFERTKQYLLGWLEENLQRAPRMPLFASSSAAVNTIEQCASCPQA